MTNEMKRSIRLVIVSMALCVPLAGGMYEAQAAPPPPGWYDNRPPQDRERNPLLPAHRSSMTPPPAHRTGMMSPPTHRPHMVPPHKTDKDVPPPMGPGFPRR